MRVLIIGGGIAGLTLAALLRQRGIEHRVIEKSIGPHSKAFRCCISRRSGCLRCACHGKPYFWKLEDVRSTKWLQPRVLLLGDAAAAFLPTAGVGASMAMESAAALADELTRTDSRHINNSLDVFTTRRMRRVRRIQNQSRRLSRLMFIKSPLISALRNGALRFATLDMLGGPIATGMNSPI